MKENNFKIHCKVYYIAYDSEQRPIIVESRIRKIIPEHFIELTNGDTFTGEFELSQLTFNKEELFDEILEDAYSEFRGAMKDLIEAQKSLEYAKALIKRERTEDTNK